MIFMLTFMRHGITDYNAQGLFQGQVDIPLNDLGFKQADLVGSYLENIKFDKIYSSDLTRCKQTVNAVVEKNKCSPPEVVLDARLREKSFGIYEGKSFAEYQRGGGRIPGGETDHEVMERLESFLEQLSKDMTKEFSSLGKDSEQGASPDTLSNAEEMHKSGMDQSEQRSEVKDGHIPSFKELGYPTDLHCPHVLFSSHGMLLRILLRLFQVQYNFKLSKGLSLGYKCPNTGLSGFLVEIIDGKLVRVDCKFVFCDFHLDPLEEDN